MRRVVITGVGLHTPLGNDLTTLYDRMLAGQSGARPMPHWAEIDELHTRVGAPCSEFDAKTRIDRKFRRTMGRVAQLAASAALEAVSTAGLDEAEIQNERTAVVVGSTAGSGDAEHDFWQHFFDARSARGIKSTLFFRGMAHTCATNIALLLGTTGEVLATNSACASSNQAIGIASDRIRMGRADVAIAGGAEELHVTAAIIFQSLGAVTTTYNDSPSSTPRPFDMNRDGIVVGEGAGIVVLEERERALARGAPIYGEILGFGDTCDARSMANPAPEGMMAAIRICLRDAGIDPSKVDYVNAHATGTAAGDAAEAKALLATIGGEVPVSSSKGHLGHLLGACGSVEAMVGLEAMRRGILPPTLNLEEPDVPPIWLPMAPVEREMHRVLKTNFAFGGVNSVLLLGSEDLARSS